MEVYASPAPSMAASTTSPLFLRWGFSEKVTEFFSSVTSAVISNVFYAIFVYYFVVVGSTLGAMTGALIGVKTKGGFFHGAAVGAVFGATLFHEVIKASVFFWHSDEMNGLKFLLHLVEIIARLLDGKLLRDHFNLANQAAAIETTMDVPRSFDTRNSNTLSAGLIDKVPKIGITDRNIYDTSGNTISCSVCLQDFEIGDVAGRLPRCHHTFHLPCIAEWFNRQSSCPLCRRTHL